MTTEQLILQLIILALSKADELTRLLSIARSEGRDVTEEELNALASADDLARARLQADIDNSPKGVG